MARAERKKCYLCGKMKPAPGGQMERRFARLPGETDDPHFVCARCLKRSERSVWAIIWFLILFLAFMFAVGIYLRGKWQEYPTSWDPAAPRQQKHDSGQPQ